MLDEALKIIEWLRDLLALTDIDVVTEAFEHIGADGDMQGYLRTIIAKPFAFHNFRTNITTNRLKVFLENYPSGFDLLEFLVSAAYEALRPIFYFPEIEGYHIKNMGIRNYYDHPDPTHLSPLVIRNSKGGASLDRTIYTRPDRVDSEGREVFEKVLIEEASRLSVTLYHTVKNLRQKIVKELQEMPDFKTGSLPQSTSSLSYEYNSIDISRLIRLHLSGTAGMQRFTLEGDFVDDCVFRLIGSPIPLNGITHF